MPHFICIVDGVRCSECVQATAMLQIEQNRCWNSAKMKICGTRIDIQLLFFNFYHSPLSIGPSYSALTYTHTRCHFIWIHRERLIWHLWSHRYDFSFDIYVNLHAHALRLTTHRRIIHRNLVSNYYYYCMNGMPRQRTVIKWHRALWLTDVRACKIVLTHCVRCVCVRAYSYSRQKCRRTSAHKTRNFNWNALVVDIQSDQTLQWYVGLVDQNKKIDEQSRKHLHIRLNYYSASLCIVNGNLILQRSSTKRYLPIYISKRLRCVWSPCL